MALKESDIRRQIQEYLRWKGFFVYYNLQLSDLVATKNGVTYHIEIKTPRGRQSEKQREFQHNLELAGGRYILARGVEDVEHLE